MDGREQHGEPERSRGGLMRQLRRVASAEAQLASQHARGAARATARSALLAVAGLGATVGALGASGVAAGLALSRRPAGRPALLALGLSALGALLLVAGWRQRPTGAVRELRGELRAQWRAFRNA